ncbi:BlaI/MecI/CopY family transcriptional regulator [Streptomyces sp. NPDC056716]|uniref:BlaI/MecI/CopY family transcriptional regulator n=1 Tax=unclassified Streptomyces TaxID=2593676 RepID=UPI00367E86EA
MRPFGELEADIMRVLWAAQDKEPVTIHAITDALDAEGRNLAYTTVMTVTERLRTKGWLTREKVSRSFRYRATRTADDYSAQLMAQALDSSADRTGALLRFAGRLDASEAAALRQALDALPGDDAAQDDGAQDGGAGGDSAGDDRAGDDAVTRPVPER